MKNRTLVLPKLCLIIIQLSKSDFLAPFHVLKFLHLYNMITHNTKSDRGNPLSLRRNFTWTLFGTLIYTGCQWAMLVVLAKLGTPEMVGIFSLSLAVIAPIIMFANLNLRTVQATDASKEYSFEVYLWLRLITMSISCVIITLIIITSRYRLNVAAVVGIITLSKIFDGISDIVYGLLQQHERMDKIASSRIMQGLSQLFVLSVTIFLTSNLLWGVTAMAVASACTTFGYDLPNALWVLRRERNFTVKGMFANLKMKVRKNFVPLLLLTRLAFPLGLVAALATLYTNLPRYFIDHYLGTHELGVYSAMSYLMIAGGSVITGSLLQSASSLLATHYINNIIAFKKLLIKLVIFGGINGVIGVIIALFFGRPLLTLLYRSEYATHPTAFTWLMAGAGISYINSALGFGISATRKFRTQIPVYILMVGVVGLGCILLIPEYGLLGASWAIFIGMLTWLLGFLAIIRNLILDREHQEVAS